jgi:hypothetical protein
VSPPKEQIRRRDVGDLQRAWDQPPLADLCARSANASVEPYALARECRIHRPAKAGWGQRAPASVPRDQ